MLWCDHDVCTTAAVVSRAKQLPAKVATSSSSGGSSNGALPNEVVSEEEELDFDKWQVRKLGSASAALVGIFASRTSLCSRPACVRL